MELIIVLLPASVVSRLFQHNQLCNVGSSSAGIATRYGFDGTGIESQ
jgi:hypothetical protein